MQQQLQVQDRLRRLEKINNNTLKAKKQIESKSKNTFIDEIENDKKIKRILFQKESINPIKIPMKDITPQENIIFPPNSSLKTTGCIVSSRNGKIIQVNSYSHKRKPSLNNPTTKSYRDEFQTVRSINLNSATTQREHITQREYIKEEIQIDRIEQQRESIHIQIQDINSRLVNKPDNRIPEELMKEKFKLEHEIAILDSFLHEKVSYRHKTWQEDKQNFESLWEQLEQTDNPNDQEDVLDDDQWTRALMERDYKEQSLKLYQQQSKQTIDRDMIDNLSREVDELMNCNNLNLELEECRVQQQQNKLYTPPMSVIEEEVSMEISFLY